MSRVDLSYYILLSYDFHDGQKRKDGITPYIFHPLAVAHKLFQVGIDDDEMIKAALFHDVLEDTEVSEDTVRAAIGDVAFGYVKSLTCRDKKEYLVSLCEGCISPLIIKVADRLCNIHDFAIDGDSYAPIYYGKTQQVFNSITYRQKEIVNIFGESVYNNLLCQVHRTKRMVYDGN